VTWNYRVIKTTNPGGEEIYGIHDVFYSRKGKVRMWGVLPSVMSSCNRKGILWETKAIAKALKLPVLTEKKVGKKTKLVVCEGPIK
jgi:hypothetical protein